MGQMGTHVGPEKWKKCRKLSKEACHHRPDCRYSKKKQQCKKRTKPKGDKPAPIVKEIHDVPLISDLNTSHITTLNPKVCIAQTPIDIYLKHILAKQRKKRTYVLPTIGLAGGKLMRTHERWLDQVCVSYSTVLLPIVHDGHYSLLVLKRSEPHIVYFADSLVKHSFHGDYHVPKALSDYLVKRNQGAPIKWMNLHSPMQINNNCGIHTMQNCEMVYHHSDVTNMNLATLLGEHGNNDNVNYLRTCMQDLMRRVEDNRIDLGKIHPFLHNTKKPVPNPKHQYVLLQDIMQKLEKNIQGDREAIVIGSNLNKVVPKQKKAKNTHIIPASSPNSKKKAWMIVDVVDGHRSEFQRMEAPGMATHIYILVILGRNWMDMERETMRLSYPALKLQKKREMPQESRYIFEMKKPI